MDLVLCLAFDITKEEKEGMDEFITVVNSLLFEIERSRFGRLIIPTQQ